MLESGPATLAEVPAPRSVVAPDEPASAPAAPPPASTTEAPPAAPAGRGRLLSLLWERRQLFIAAAAVAGIAVHVVMRFALRAPAPAARLPLLVVLAVGGLPVVADLLARLWRREFGSDLLAGLSIVTSVLLGEYLAGSLVVLMLSGGQALEEFAVRSASSVLRALAARVPSVAHLRRRSGGAAGHSAGESPAVADVAMGSVGIGDLLLVFPHEICPVDGVVVEGRGVMDESYLTGEPFRMSKVPGSQVLSGAVNGESALTIRATKIATDSRYARIMQVMRASERDTPRLRRLGDQLGAWYTPLAVAIAVGAWVIGGSAERFLAVLVVATPCPLLIAIPVAIIGSISLCARRGIIVKKPAVLEQVDGCRTLIFDKTGTLTYGEPRVSEVLTAPGFDRSEAIRLTASLERYSKHPLAGALLRAARDAGLPLPEASEISEPPGEGLRGVVAGRGVRVTSRKKLSADDPAAGAELPPPGEGLECAALVDGRYAATFRFRDEPRADGKSFVRHLRPRHGFRRLVLVSGDRRSEVRYLAGRVGIAEVHAGKSPEEKLEIVKRETAAANTLYVGDGINDAPALMAATVGVALGRNSDITAEAAGAVIMEPSLAKVDEFLHVGRRMRRVALESAVGGMALSVLGMALASSGHLPPVAGAIAQEVIDVLAVLNALRAALPPKMLTDF